MADLLLNGKLMAKKKNTIEEVNSIQDKTLYMDDSVHNVKIYCGNCVDVMRNKLDDNSVDCVLTDPPYNLGNFMLDRNTNIIKMRENSFAYAGWDNMNYEEWVKVMREFFGECHRVLKKKGAVILFMSIIKVESIIKLAQEAGFYYKTTGIWHKTNPMPRNMGIQFVTSNECWIYLVKDSTSGTFNNGGKMKPDFVESSVCPNSEKKYGKHPTQKPLKIIKELLECVTNAGDTVLDPFCGSGTTCVASAILGRKSIGIDLEDKYCEISKQRISNMEG